MLVDAELDRREIAAPLAELPRERLDVQVEAGGPASHDGRYVFSSRRTPSDWYPVRLEQHIPLARLPLEVGEEDERRAGFASESGAKKSTSTGSGTASRRRSTPAAAYASTCHAVGTHTSSASAGADGLRRRVALAHRARDHPARPAGRPAPHAARVAVLDDDAARREARRARRLVGPRAADRRRRWARLERQGRGILAALAAEQHDAQAVVGEAVAVERAGTKPSATSVKKPEKPQPTGTRHRRRDGRRRSGAPYARNYGEQGEVTTTSASAQRRERDAIVELERACGVRPRSTCDGGSSRARAQRAPGLCSEK